ncbi:transporter substrate-binding domain-containing protein [Pseudomonas sp. UL073]|uniref:Transporter substrate-binding domain-containing protein n=1 Tax=Zestomonas insulae TaxID=2809017 RepID=A0ABS2IK00_9GAMM|nr:transporter substrate-binding domain-containing protein [Pseudomonas insulae]MBM7062302.1 transporter substrate-binding domain-containing protein [Pseudomonas insulae]
MSRILLLLLCMALGLAARAEPLRLVADPWPPFTDIHLPNRGLAGDLVSSALDRAGYTLDYSEKPWARALHELQSGACDVLVDAWYSPERAAYALYSEPYLVNRIRLFQRRGAAIPFSSLADLRGRSIAVVRGYSYAPAFDNDPALQRVPVIDFEMGARMLAAGRVELFVEDEWAAQFHLQRSLPELREQFDTLPRPLAENGLHILVRKSHPQAAQIVAAFNRALQAMRDDGSYARIVAAHEVTARAP